MNQRTPIDTVVEIRRQSQIKTMCWPAILFTEMLALCDEFERLQGIAAHADQAIDIADNAMAGTLYCHCRVADERLYLLNEAGAYVRELEDAEMAIVEAFEWLQQRGLATLQPADALGAYIVLDEVLT